LATIDPIPLGDHEVTDLVRYLEQIVEPTVEDFRRNPLSVRHAFLACVATYHAIDRATYPQKPGNLRKQWGKESLEFTIVDMVAHHFKHVRSNDERPTPGFIPLPSTVFGATAFNTKTFNDSGMDVRNLLYVVQDAVKFLRKKAAAN
jgi:hypothetical protein